MFSERWERYWQLLRLVGNVLSRARKGRLGDGRGGGCKLLRVVVVGFWLSMWSRKGGWIGEEGFIPGVACPPGHTGFCDTFRVDDMPVHIEDGDGQWDPAGCKSVHQG